MAHLAFRLNSLVYLPTGQRARLLSVNPATELCHVQILDEDMTEGTDQNLFLPAHQLEPYDAY